MIGILIAERAIAASVVWPVRVVQVYPMSNERFAKRTQLVRR